MPRHGIRQGFTLVEMLVVIGIMAVVMGIGVGAFVAASRTNKIVAAESLLADQLRQARHAARTTGQPVVLRLRAIQDAGGTAIGGVITGLTVAPIWHRMEGWPKNWTWEPDPVDPNNPNAPETGTWKENDVPGHTGMALALPHALQFPEDPNSKSTAWTLDIARFVLPTASNTDPSPVLDRGQRLARGASDQPAAGFSIGLWVRPPPCMVYKAGDGTKPGKPQLSQEVLPLLLIGPEPDSGSHDVNPATSDATPVSANMGQALAGIMLINSFYSGTVLGNTTMQPTWEIVGFVNPEGGDPHDPPEVSSIKDRLKDLSGTAPGSLTLRVNDPDPYDDTGLKESGLDVEAPLVGGSWTHLVFSYDGKRLLLQRDGRRVAEKNVDAFTFRQASERSERVYLGFAKIPGFPSPPSSNTGKAVQAPDPDTGGATLIDDVTIVRQGTEREVALGGGVYPVLPPGVTEHRITSHPDGRVEVDATGAAAAAVESKITLRSPAGQEARVTIGIDGRITSEVVTP